MAQRRTPSGQGPARRPGTEQRGTSRRSTSTARGASGSTGRGAASSAGRSASRPASARRAAAAGGAQRTRAPRPRGRFTGRAAVLALVLSALVLAYAYPVRTYLDQRAEISQLKQDQQAQRRRIAGLEQERAKWNDPEYVRAQARSRLQYVRPGEVAYVIVSDPAGAARDNPGAGRSRASDSGPWYGRLWSSVQAADQPTTK